jgi:hypothetical protein
MILWSKGLGKLVLRMSLAERSSAGEGDGKLVIYGTMGAPTHWDYAVKMKEDDVLDFVELLKQPAPVRYVVEGGSTGRLARTALLSGVLFAWNTIRCFLGMVPISVPTPAPTPAPTPTATPTATPKSKAAGKPVAKIQDSSPNNAAQTPRSE